MSSVNYQTIKLGRGKHKSPDDGACVMELASMLANEPFSDHPASVCPVIGAFLRTYNDSLDDERRQDLYAYASKVVGSRASMAIERARLDHLVEWVEERRGYRRTRRLASTWRRLFLEIPQSSVHATVQEVVRCARPTDESHAGILALLDEVLFIGTHGWKAGQGAERATHLASMVAG